MSVQAEGDRLIEVDEVVNLADAVAPHEGIATGMGTASYGAQIVVEATTSDEAVEKALATFTAAVDQAGLPPWPITHAETMAEDDETDYGFEDEGE